MYIHKYFFPLIVIDEFNYGLWIIDLTIDPNFSANLNLSTSYGEIYSDLKLISVSATQNNYCGSNASYIMNGGGIEIDLTSTYDNIYLRSKKSI